MAKGQLPGKKDLWVRVPVQSQIPQPHFFTNPINWGSVGIKIRTTTTTITTNTKTNITVIIIIIIIIIIVIIFTTTIIIIMIIITSIGVSLELTTSLPNYCTLTFSIHQCTMKVHNVIMCRLYASIIGAGVLQGDPIKT
ncbi:hypothetical protein M0804_011285 [Polistes exclamans]|nr:hypothetical protein M0804_011285 [Polistes exclamans]